MARSRTLPSAVELRERFEEDRLEVRELLELAYRTEPPAWALRDKAAPLALRLLDTAREAIEALEVATL